MVLSQKFLKNKTNAMTKIQGGYYIKARCIQNSDIAHAPPHVREIWDWLVKEANHKDVKYGNNIVRRGQLFRTYNDIREGLKWTVGYRTERYSENQTKKAMAYLRKATMIDTTKELGGVLITIINYDKYQNPENYEGTTKEPTKVPTKEPMRNHPLPDTNKNVKNEKKKEEIKGGIALAAQTPAQEAADFFSSEYKQSKLVEFMVSKGVDLDTANKEVTKFVLYWTEPNGTGNKEKWQMQQTFDVKRRITTWLSKVGINNKTGKIPSKSITL